MDTLMKILTHVITALLAVIVTLFCVVAFDKNNTPARTESTTNATGENVDPDYCKLEELQDLIETYYIEIDSVDMEDLKDAAAAAMVDATGDLWSYYISADELQAYYESVNNAYVGVGITIIQQEETGYLEVMEVAAGGPAETAGVLTGDLITGADNKSFQGMTIEEAADYVSGEEGTEVTLQILRGDEAFDLTMTRAKIDVPVAVYEMLDHNIGMIRIENFDAKCASETIAAIEDLLSQGATSLIFDVRNNPGGYKDEMCKVLDYLLPEGDLFKSVDYAGREEVDTSDADFLDIPMVVLVNDDSYSAAEFFAACLDEYDAATIVGTQTFGKGHFQVTMSLEDGSAVALSIGKYFTPSGKSLAGVGLTPDEIVEVDEETYLEIYYNQLPVEEDPQIQAAISILIGE